MSCVVVGSVALDTVETPFGHAQEALGGTAVYFSVAASHFTNVSVVGVVGSDFPEEHLTLLQSHGCDLEGLQRAPGRTFRWVGSYDENMNVAHTLDTQLNVFEAFRPELPLKHRRARTLFLGNIDPELQLEVLGQIEAPRLTALDTMNFWIGRSKEALTDVIRRVDVVLVNEDEARQYAGTYSIAESARFIREFGPRCVIIKRGEYGSTMFSDDCHLALPAFPTENVQDTTGAGDSFAGGFLGYLDTVPKITDSALRRALAYGTIMASFTVEGFSVQGVAGVVEEDIGVRYGALKDITSIETTTDREITAVQRGA